MHTACQQWQHKFWCNLKNNNASSAVMYHEGIYYTPTHARIHTTSIWVCVCGMQCVCCVQQQVYASRQSLSVFLNLFIFVTHTHTHTYTHKCLHSAWLRFAPAAAPVNRARTHSSRDGLQWEWHFYFSDGRRWRQQRNKRNSAMAFSLQWRLASLALLCSAMHCQSICPNGAARWYVTKKKIKKTEQN